MTREQFEEPSINRQLTTLSQYLVLKHIHEFYAENECGPDYRSLVEVIGGNSTSYIRDIIIKLEAKGYIGTNRFPNGNIRTGSVIPIGNLEDIELNPKVRRQLDYLQSLQDSK